MKYESLINILYHYGVNEENLDKATSEIIDLMYEVEFWKPNWLKFKITLNQVTNMTNEEDLRNDLYFIINMLEFRVSEDALIDIRNDVNNIIETLQFDED